MAETQNAENVIEAPSQAPMPAISFTSPAPIPPTLYKGRRQARPAAMPARAMPNPSQPETEALYASPVRTIGNVIQLGTLNCLPSIYAATIKVTQTSLTCQVSMKKACQSIW